MKLVIVESPYGGYKLNSEEVEENVRYAYEACRDCLNRGESGWGSHIIWTQFLDDKNPEHRRLGMLAGLAWSRVADYHAFYTDRGWSDGMLTALLFCLADQIPFRVRALHGEVVKPPVWWLEERGGWMQSYISSVMEMYK